MPTQTRPLRPRLRHFHEQVDPPARMTLRDRARRATTQVTRPAASVDRLNVADEGGHRAILKDRQNVMAGAQRAAQRYAETKVRRRSDAQQRGRRRPQLEGRERGR